VRGGSAGSRIGCGCNAAGVKSARAAWADGDRVPGAAANHAVEVRRAEARLQVHRAAAAPRQPGATLTAGGGTRAMWAGVACIRSAPRTAEVRSKRAHGGAGVWAPAACLRWPQAQSPRRFASCVVSFLYCEARRSAPLLPPDCPGPEPAGLGCKGTARPYQSATQN
jgi:hypothetical protein